MNRRTFLAAVSAALVLAGAGGFEQWQLREEVADEIRQIAFSVSSRISFYDNKPVRLSGASGEYVVRMVIDRPSGRPLWGVCFLTPDKEYWREEVRGLAECIVEQSEDGFA